MLTNMFRAAVQATRPFMQTRTMTMTSFKTPRTVAHTGLQSFIEQRLAPGTHVETVLTPSPLQSFLQRRWGRGGFRGGNRGNTYQPNTLKRKRRLGFLARMCSRTGRRIVKYRKEKGRWFLTY